MPAEASLPHTSLGVGGDTERRGLVEGSVLLVSKPCPHLEALRHSG